MPPIIALILTTMFILYGIRLDQKQHPEVSNALWIVIIWMFFTTKSLSAWIGANEGSTMTDGEGSPVDRMFLVVILITSLLILKKRQFNLGKAIKDNPWLVLLIGYLLVSVLWSDMPFVSFKRWTRQCLLPIVMAFVIVSEVDPKQSIESLFRRIIYIRIPFCLLAINYFPNYGVSIGEWNDELYWNGIAYQKNGMVMICVFSILFLFWAFLKRRQGKDIRGTWYQLLIIMIALWVMGGPEHTPTYSATGFVSLVIGLTTVIGLLWLKRFNIKVGANLLTFIVLFIMIIGVITPFLGKLPLFDISQIVGRESNLTGRDLIWAKLVPAAMENSLFGHGFGGFWTDEWRVKINATGAHNGYLDVILNTGFTGLILTLLFLISSCRKAQREMGQNFYYGILWYSIILILILRNITEATLGGFSTLVIIVILLTINSSTMKKKKRFRKK